jgi:hypothetical protein
MFAQRFFVFSVLCLVLGGWLLANGTPHATAEPPAPADVQTTNISIEASQDAFIASNRPNDRFGATSPTVIGIGHRPDNGAQRVVVQFDLAGRLPTNAYITKAEIMMYTALGLPSEDPPMGTEMRPLLGPWSEQLITWNNVPERGDVVANAGVLSVGNGEAIWNITNLVQAWHRGTQANHGVIIIGDENPNQGRVRNLHSREGDIIGLRPRLFITYGQDTLPPTVTMNPLPDLVRDPFTVSWQGQDNDGGSGIAHFQVEYRKDFGAWQVWLNQTQQTAELFNMGETGSYYDFRVRATDRAGNVSAFSNEVRVLYGVGRPVTAMEPLPPFSNAPGLFTVRWRLVDGGNGEPIRYRLWFRFNGGEWNLQNDNLNSTQISLFPHLGDGFYEYSVQGVNRFGIEEPFRNWGVGTYVDRQPPFLDQKLYLPLLGR